MSGSGAPTIETTGAGSGMDAVIIAASWHTEVMEGLRAGAHRVLAGSGAASRREVSVPGSFELPVAAAAAAAAGADLIVALGVVIRGSTAHFDYICQAATQGLTEVTIRTGVPIGFGVLTCDDEHQARQRAGLPGAREDKGAEAAEAALATAVSLHRLRGAAGLRP